MFSHSFNWGTIELGLHIESGRIVSSVIYSDAMDSRLIKSMADSLTGLNFCKRDILNRLTGMIGNAATQNVIEDVVKWLDTKSIY